MEPPKKGKIIQWSTSTLWFDEDGILYSLPLGVLLPKTKEEALREMEEFRNIIDHKKICMIAKIDNLAPPPKKEDRDWIAKELDSVVKAMAIISTSPLSKMVANLFFGFKPPAYPYRFFSNIEDAKVWIKQYAE